MTPAERILSGRTFNAECVFMLGLMPENSIDSCVCDPPYHLQSIVKRFGKDSLDNGGVVATRCRERADGYGRLARGFMGQEWDGGDVAFRPETWAAVYRVLKPGAHLLAFSGTRTYHRMATAIEDAGFELRDMLGWAYGQGFPKSHNLEGSWEGWGTALKPAYEPICLARKPLSEKTVAANVQRWGTGALNIDGCRIELPADDWLSGGLAGDYERIDTANREGSWGFKRVDREAGLGRWPANFIHDGSDEATDFLPAGAARFFYCAKASKNDRRGSKHPTVKPISLIRNLSRLVTPPGGTILDPFAGSGTLAEAAALEDFDFVLIEKSDDYYRDIRARVFDFAMTYNQDQAVVAA